MPKLVRGTGDTMKTIPITTRLEACDLANIVRHFHASGYWLRTRSSIIAAVVHSYAAQINATSEEPPFINPGEAQQFLEMFRVASAPSIIAGEITPTKPISDIAQQVAETSEEDLAKMFKAEFDQQARDKAEGKLEPESDLDPELNPEPRSEFWR